MMRRVLAGLVMVVFSIVGSVVVEGSIMARTCEAGTGGAGTEGLFPTDLPGRDWVHFAAQGFHKPVCGVVYRLGDTVTNGLALGGIDTGCIDLETSGLLGYSTIFNSHVLRRGPVNLPILGIHVDDETEKERDVYRMT